MTVSVSTTSLFTVCWLIGIISFWIFLQTFRAGTPDVQVVDIDQLLADAQSAPANSRPLQNLDLSGTLMSEAGAAEIKRAHRQKLWLSGLVALAGLSISFVVPQRLWHDYLVSASCVLSGPVAFLGAAMEH